MLEGFRQKKDEVTAALRDLGKAAQSIGARSLLARLESELVGKLEADRFHLVVVGEFNHGKSTFVNALLGRTVLPAGVTPTTAVIHHLEHAEVARARVVYANGDKRELPFEAVRKFSVGGAEEGAASDVAYLEVGYPAEILRERIVLVDTPGVNDLSLQRADITYSYIPRSDAVLFLLDAGQPLKESERVFLQEKLLGQSRDKIIFVVTKRDIWSDDEQTEALAYVRTELGKLVKSPVVFAVSAERALEGKPLESGMPELLAHLTSFLAEERGRILLDNALGEGLEVGRLLAQGIDARRRAAAMTAEELTRKIELLESDLVGQTKTIEERRAAIREEVAAIKAWARRDLERFVEDVIKSLPSVIDDASTGDIKTHLAPFLERTLTDWAKAETQEIASALEALAERTIAIVKEDAHDVAKRVSAALGTNVRPPKVEVDTFGYDVGVVALATVGVGVMFTNALLGGLLTLAAPVLAIYLKGKVETETRKRAHEAAPQAIRDAAARIGPKLDEMIGDFAKRLDEWVVTAGEELHREVIEVLRAARDEREKAHAGSMPALAVCEQQERELGGVVTRLGGLRTALWPAAVAEAPPPVTPATNAPGGAA
jgi:ribosome biogenesis GTPase A